ncbi:amino acid ABC transporter ATP-binding protein [Robbsia andropogonis]|uniref:amino acid ABC transporter ATP-binding protein n=1 Tax=Robbsia andropogonis TaxID=28092 RepID=UPI003D25F9ED
MTPIPSHVTVRATGIVKSFGANRVLRGIDFLVNKGEVIVIMGPSGSGKTTLLRSLNFLDMPDSGTVEICGIPLTIRPDARLSRRDHKQIQAMRQKSAMVFQSFNLFPHMTALANVMEGPRFVKGMSHSSAQALARQQLSRARMLEKSDAYPAKLSGGQKQRVAIARALAMEPEVILFDEPTSALDPALRDDVLQTMRGLASDGMTMLVVTHEVKFARDVADRIVFMRDGVVLSDTPPEAFFRDDAPEEVRRFLSRIGG